MVRVRSDTCLQSRSIPKQVGQCCRLKSGEAARLIFRAVRYCPRLSCRPLAIRRRSSSCKVRIRPLRLRAASSARLRAVMLVSISSQPTAFPFWSRNVVQRLATVTLRPISPPLPKLTFPAIQSKNIKKRPLGIPYQSIPELICRVLLPSSSRKRDAPHPRSNT